MSGSFLLGISGANIGQVHLVRGMLGVCIQQHHLRQQPGNWIDIN